MSDQDLARQYVAAGIEAARAIGLDPRVIDPETVSVIHGLLCPLAQMWKAREPHDAFPFLAGVDQLFEDGYNQPLSTLGFAIGYGPPPSALDAAWIQAVTALREQVTEQAAENA
jgi:hypothetical protein